jgi:hypothetical protein
MLKFMDQVHMNQEILKCRNNGMDGRYQRRTLTGTGRKKTVPGSTGKNLRSSAAIPAAAAMIMAGFFCISLENIR